MNRIPFYSFTVLGHVKSFTLSRETHGYKEVSIMDVYRVLSCGFPMFAMAIRSGDEEWSHADLERVARITPGTATVKELLDIWRATFLSGHSEDIAIEIGVMHRDWSGSIEDRDEKGLTAYRLVIRGSGSNKDRSWLYCANCSRMGLIASELDALVSYNETTLEILAMSLSFGHNSQALHDTVTYLVNTYEEPMMMVIQKQVGERSWVDHKVIKGVLHAGNSFNHNEFIKQIQ